MWSRMSSGISYKMNGLSQSCYIGKIFTKYEIMLVNDEAFVYWMGSQEPLLPQPPAFTNRLFNPPLNLTAQTARL